MNQIRCVKTGSFLEWSFGIMKSKSVLKKFTKSRKNLNLMGSKLLFVKTKLFDTFVSCREVVSALLSVLGAK